MTRAGVVLACLVAAAGWQEEGGRGPPPDLDTGATAAGVELSAGRMPCKGLRRGVCACTLPAAKDACGLAKARPMRSRSPREVSMSSDSKRQMSCRRTTPRARRSRMHRAGGRRCRRSAADQVTIGSASPEAAVAPAHTTVRVIEALDVGAVATTAYGPTVTPGRDRGCAPIRTGGRIVAEGESRAVGSIPARWSDGGWRRAPPRAAPQVRSGEVSARRRVLGEVSRPRARRPRRARRRAATASSPDGSESSRRRGAAPSTTAA